MLSTVTSHFHLSYNQNVANWNSPTLTSPKCMIISKNYLCCICTRMNPSIFETTHLQLKEPLHIQKNPSTIERNLKMLKLFKKAIFTKEHEAVLASGLWRLIYALKMRSMSAWLKSWLFWSHWNTSFRVYIDNRIAIGNACSMMASIWQMMSFCLTFTWINLVSCS